jgi:hypothetical protein
VFASGRPALPIARTRKITGPAQQDTYKVFDLRMFKTL